MTPRDTPESWPVTASEDLYRDDWVIALRADLVHAPDHPEPTFRRLVVEHPGAAAVLAVDEQQRVLCLRHYRHASGQVFVEVPAGLCDVAGEPALEVARRELREEAGHTAEEWISLGPVWPSPGITEEEVHLFFARGLRDVGRGDFELTHEEAHMEVFWMPWTELRTAVLEGQVRHGITALMVLLAEARGLLH